MGALVKLLAAAWLLWGAVLPIFVGLVVAARLDLNLWAGALGGGLVAVPLLLWGNRLAERWSDRQDAAPPAAAGPSVTHTELSLTGWLVGGLGAVAWGWSGWSPARRRSSCREIAPGRRSAGR